LLLLSVLGSSDGERTYGAPVFDSLLMVAWREYEWLTWPGERKVSGAEAWIWLSVFVSLLSAAMKEYEKLPRRLPVLLGRSRRMSDC